MIFASGGISIDPNAPLFPTLVLVVFLFASSFFFSGTETALFSLQAIDRQQLMASGRIGGLVGRLLGRRAATLTTILMGNEFTNITLAATTAALCLRFFPEWPWLNVVVLTPILVLVSEITPKFMAIRGNRAWSMIAAVPLFAFAFVLTPLRWIFERIVITGARVFRVDPLAMTEGLEEAELMILVDRGAAAGSLEATERELIESVFELTDLTVDRVMTPRPDIFAVPVDVQFETLLELARTHGKSRIPVYETDLDKIVGVLLVKELLHLRHRPERRTSNEWIRPLLRPPIAVPASKPADAMFREFVKRKHHMAFIFDEYGTVMGLVTLDDLVTEILGGPETETAEHPDDPTDHRPHRLLVRAATDLEDFEDDTGIALPEGDYNTVGGFVFHSLGRMPHAGDTVQFDQHALVVKSMDGTRIHEIEVHAKHAGAE